MICLWFASILIRVSFVVWAKGRVWFSKKVFKASKLKTGVVVEG